MAKSMSRKAKAKRGELKICGAPKKSGEPCLQDAGHGTDHPGRGQCKVHDSSGDSRGIVHTARKMGVPAVVTPTQAITGVLHIATGNLAYITAKVMDLDDDEVMNEERGINRWVLWQERAMDRVARYAATAVGMGVAERQVQLAEQQTRLMGVLLEAVASDLDLTPAQRKKLGPAIRKNLQVIEAQAKEVVDA